MLSNEDDKLIRAAWRKVAGSDIRVAPNDNDPATLSVQEILHLLLKGFVRQARVPDVEIDDDARRILKSLGSQYGDVLAKQRLSNLGYRYNDRDKCWRKRVLIVTPEPGWMFGK